VKKPWTSIEKLQTKVSLYFHICSWYTLILENQNITVSRDSAQREIVDFSEHFVYIIDLC
jgi:hypothetical protein